MKALKGRLKAIWLLLTKRNFILIHSIEKGFKDEKAFTRVAVLRRTDHKREDDFLSMKMAIFLAFPETYVQPQQLNETEQAALSSTMKRTQQTTSTLSGRK